MTTPPMVLKLSAPAAAGEEYFLPSEKLIAGNPRQTVWKRYVNSSSKFFTGIWQSEPGKWSINYSEEEYCEILQGTSVITDSAGHVVRVSAGERFVIPRGFVGTWEVLETTRKVYVICEPGA